MSNDIDNSRSSRSKEERFTQTPDRLITDANISDGAYRVLNYILSWQDAPDKNFPVSEIMDKLNRSRNTARKQLSELLSKGYIRKVREETSRRGASYKANIYVKQSLVFIEDKDLEGQKLTPWRVKNCPPRGSKIDPVYRDYIKEINIKETVPIKDSPTAKEPEIFPSMAHEWNKMCDHNMPKVRRMNKDRNDKIKKALKIEPDINYWIKIFEMVRDSLFLSGRVKEWRADLFWVISVKNNSLVNAVKIEEDKYRSKNTAAQPKLSHNAELLQSLLGDINE